MVTATAQVQNPSENICDNDAITKPCMIIIMGASGDLTSRKIVPALFNLYLDGRLPDPFVIIGCARTAMKNDEFRERMKKACMPTNGTDDSSWKTFSSALHYRAIDYEQPASYVTLADTLTKLDEKWGTGGNRIYYLAIPPTLYKPVTQMIGEAGLASESENSNGWARIVVEKPFGHDLSTAIDLDNSLHVYFREHQIFRIDHYLAKETVQNILMFRFTNAMFEPIWNRNYIDHIQIIATETLGVEHRAGYYEQAGVLRDMFQNHMMQLLALTAMEPPAFFEVDRVRDEKVKVYRAIRPFNVKNAEKYLVVGQYGRGTIAGQKVPAYRDEHGVSSGSLTPTFAMMKIFLDNWRWRGVPFYLMSGKRLARKLTEINIHFKKVPHSMFRETLGEQIAPNLLALGIYPEERITLTFQTKDPGTKICLRSVTMDFHYNNDPSPALEAYEKVLLDVILGDHMLFWRQDGVELCWSFLTPILEQCETCGDRPQHLHFYESGTWGPEAIQKLGEFIYA
ncbi:MAG: glucose-6-phosphate dehydrogenase [Desulfobacterales bacterium]|nr:glucose-6-phosphate dehydrogenase [Desulfobacterales bacterium]